MKTIKVILTCLLFFQLGCQKEKKETDTVNWPQKMRTTAKAMNEILPYIYNESKFKNKKEFKRAEAKIAHFAQSIHSIPVKDARKILGDDPYILANLTQLKDLASRAHSSFKNGGFEHSRVLLKAAVTNCFKCHTRTQFGPSNYYWKNFNISKLNSDDLEKAQLHIALRQYKQAKSRIQKYLETKEQQGRYDTAYENAMKFFLMITLRGEGSIDEARVFVNKKINSGRHPQRMEDTLKAWNYDLIYWTKNKNKLKPNLATAKKLLEKGGGKISLSVFKSDNMINNFLASSLIHKALMGKLSRPEKAQAYYYLGNIYNAILLAGFWDLPETYFEMCIKYAPKSKTAKKCYKEYRDNIVLGYSGTSGTLIPHYEYDKLEKLRVMAGAK